MVSKEILPEAVVLKIRGPKSAVNKAHLIIEGGFIILGSSGVIESDRRSGEVHEFLTCLINGGDAS